MMCANVGLSLVAAVFGWYRPENRGSFRNRNDMRPGLTEILIILGIVLLLFGAGRLADIGKGLGEGIRNFKKGLKEDEDEEDDEEDQLPEPKKKKSKKKRDEEDEEEDDDEYEDDDE